MTEQQTLLENETEEFRILSNRNEFLFLYDIKMGNPNGDPDENRPRVLPDNTVFVTDVRMKRFIRDYFLQKKQEILVGKIEGKTTNLTGRVAHYLKSKGLKRATGEEIANILQKAFIDARVFGSSYAFKKMSEQFVGDDKPKDWEPKPIPKTMTGPVQFNMGEVLHDVEQVDIHGTTTFGSDEEKSQGTFTQYFGIRYGLIAFSGVANEYSAGISKLSDEDYADFLIAMWKSVRESANTRTKKGQIPHFLLNITYKSDSEFQFGRLQDYVKTVATNGKDENEWKSPEDYKLDISLLLKRLEKYDSKIEKISYQISDDIHFAGELPENGKWINLDLDGEKKE